MFAADLLTWRGDAMNRALTKVTAAHAKSARIPLYVLRSYVKKCRAAEKRAATAPSPLAAAAATAAAAAAAAAPAPPQRPATPETHVIRDCVRCRSALIGNAANASTVWQLGRRDGAAVAAPPTFSDGSNICVECKSVGASKQKIRDGADRQRAAQVARATAALGEIAIAPTAGFGSLGGGGADTVFAQNVYLLFRKRCFDANLSRRERGGREGVKRGLAIDLATSPEHICRCIKWGYAQRSSSK